MNEVNNIDTRKRCPGGFYYLYEVETLKSTNIYGETHSPIEVYQGILRLTAVLVEYERQLFDSPAKMYGLNYYDRLENTFINLKCRSFQHNNGSGYPNNICWLFIPQNFTPFTFTDEMKQRTWEDVADIIISRSQTKELEHICSKLGKFMNPASNDFEGMYYGSKVYSNGQWGVDIPALVIHNTDDQINEEEGWYEEKTLPFSERADNTSDSNPLIYRYDVRRLHPAYGIHALGTMIYSDPYYGCGQHRFLPFASLQPSEPAQSNQNPNLPINTWHQELFQDIPPQPNINSNISRITWNQEQIQHESFKEILIREMKYTQGWSLTVSTSIPRLIYTTFNDIDKIEKPKRRWSI